MEHVEYKPRCDDSSGSPVEAPDKWRFIDCSPELVTLFYGDFKVSPEDQMDEFAKELANGVITRTLLDIPAFNDKSAGTWRSLLKFLPDEVYSEIKFGSRDEAMKHVSCLAKAWTPALEMLRKLPVYDASNPPEDIISEGGKQRGEYRACMGSVAASSAKKRRW